MLHGTTVNLRHGARLLLLVAGAVLLSGLVGVAGAAGVADGDVGFTPTLTTTAQLAAAEPLDGELTGLSENEPLVCTSLTGGLNKSVFQSKGRTGIGASPAQLESSRLQPGRAYRYCVLATNRSDDAVRVKFTTIDVVGSPDPDTQQTIEVTPVAVGTWVHPLKGEVEIPAGRTYEIPYVVDVPTTVPAGTQVGGIRLTTLPAVEGANTVRSSVVQPLYVTFPGGQARRLKVSDLDAPRVLSRKKGDLAYRAKFTVTNEGTVVDAYVASLSVRGIGREIASSSTGTNVMLPSEAGNVELKWSRLPWIGWYKPKVELKSRNGTQEIDVPRVLILPPTPYVIAILVAILLPLLYLLYRWRRRRQEWMAYLMEELEREERGEDGEDGEEDAGDYWDPMRQT